MELTFGEACQYAVGCIASVLLLLLLAAICIVALPFILFTLILFLI